MIRLIKNPFFIYLIKFFAIFCVAYYGTIAVEGLAAPNNYYSPLIDRWLDYPSSLRSGLLNGCKFFLALFGYDTSITDAYHLQMVGGMSVQLVYTCLGVGVMSFWLAFVLANKGSFWKKFCWVMGGMLVIWLINVFRISLVLLANNKQAKIPFNMDNHDFFTVLAYGAIFLLMFLYDRSFKGKKVIEKG